MGVFPIITHKHMSLYVDSQSLNDTSTYHEALEFFDGKDPKGGEKMTLGPMGFVASLRKRNIELNMCTPSTPNPSLASVL